MYLKFIIKNYWKSIVTLIVIHYLSFAPPSTFKGVPTFQYNDKIVHFLLYAGLTMIIIFEYYQSVKFNVKRLVFGILCVVFPIILGGLIEILQENFFKPRTGTWGDWAADIAGVLMGWLIMYLLKSKLPRKKIL
jgi:VanZ family protein